MSVGRTFVAAVGNRPHLVVAVHHQRRGLDADYQFVHHFVRLGVDFQDAVLIRPAVREDVLAVLHHLFRGSRLVVHVRLDVTRYLVGLGIDDIDARVPDLRDIGLFVRKKMDVPGRSESRDTADLLERIGVDGENHARIVHHNPADPLVNDHRLRYVAQFHAIGAGEYLVLHMLHFRVIIRERRIAVHEIAFVGDEQPFARDLIAVPEIAADVEGLLVNGTVSHARGEQDCK